MRTLLSASTSQKLVEAEVKTQVKLSACVCPPGERAEGIEHTEQLSVLAEAGLVDDAALAAVGWEPVLLAAIERGQGWGRPSRAADAM